MIAKTPRPKSSENSVAALRDTVLGHLTYTIGKDRSAANVRDWFFATALAARDRVVDRWFEAQAQVSAGKQRHVYYMSLEFLIGRLLMNPSTIWGSRRICEQPWKAWMWIRFAA